MARLGLLVVLLALAAPAWADGYHYQPGLHPDPFRAPELAQAKPACAEGQAGCVDLAALKVTALVTGRSRPIAMLEDDRGESYIVRVGQFLGRGRVESIGSGKVVIVELHPGPTGPVRVSHELKLD